MSYRTVQVSLDSQGVLHVILNRPEVRNAFNPDVMDDLAHAFGVEALKDSVKAIGWRSELDEKGSRLHL